MHTKMQQSWAKLLGKWNPDRLVAFGNPYFLGVRETWICNMVSKLKICSLFPSSLKKSVEEALKGSQLPTIMDFSKFSRNYQLSKSVSLPSLDPVSAKIEGNLIFDPNNYLPKESMLKTTLTVFGFAPGDLFEVCVRLRRSSHSFSSSVQLHK